jgi:site-specific DNA recombinase
MISLFEKYDVALISITEGIDTSTYMGKYFSYISGIFAEMEVNSIVIQAKNGMIQRAKNGLWNGGLVLGYDTLDKKLIINDEEANTVRKIFQLYTEDCWGYNKITKYLNQNIELYATKKKSTWSYFTVKNVIDNPVYAGYIRWGTHVDWSKKRRKGKSDDYILVEGKHDAIISIETWSKALERRKQSTKEVIKTDQYTYLLSGLLKCPSCGASMTSHKVEYKW